MCYLKGVEEQLTVHADLPAQAFKCVRHSNKDDVVDAKHQNQHKGGLGQFPTRHIHVQCIFYRLPCTSVIVIVVTVAVSRRHTAIKSVIKMMKNM